MTKKVKIEIDIVDFILICVVIYCIVSTCGSLKSIENKLDEIIEQHSIEEVEDEEN